MNKEIKSLTGIRGIASFLVVLHHFRMYVIPNEKIVKHSISLSGRVLDRVVDHLYIMVELFFILSGFVLSLSYKNKFRYNVGFSIYRDFMIKRFCRVYPLFFVSTVYYFLILKPYSSFSHGIIKLFSNFTFLTVLAPRSMYINEVTWSLSAEWIIYLIFPLMFLWLYNLKKNRTLYIIGVIIFILSPLLNSEMFFDKNFHIDYFTLRSSNGTGALLRCVGSYIIGVLMFRIYEGNKGFVLKCNKYWWIILLMVMILLPFYKADIILDILLGFLILSVIENTNRLSKFLSSKGVYYLGLISYSMYINHQLFVLLIRKYLNENNLAPDTTFCVFSLILTLFCTILLSHITYILIEKRLNVYLKSKLLKTGIQFSSELGK